MRRERDDKVYRETLIERYEAANPQPKSDAYDTWVNYKLEDWGRYKSRDFAPLLAQGAPMTDPAIVKSIREAMRAPAPIPDTLHDGLMECVNTAVMNLPTGVRPVIEIHYRGVLQGPHNQQRFGRIPVTRAAQVLGMSRTEFNRRLDIGKHRVAAFLIGMGLQVDG